jgi:RNA polymerase sigma-70 factor (ECF subfamily)
MSHSDDKKARVEQFDAVVDGCETRLLRYATRILGNADLAQDVVQDTLISLYRNWDGDMVLSGPMMTWLYRTAHNRAIDYFRREDRRGRLHERHAQEAPGEPPRDPSAVLAARDSEQQAIVALEVLSARERHLVILKVFEERTYAEIAEIAGLTATNVGYILHHAMKKLAAELGGKQKS